MTSWRKTSWPRQSVINSRGEAGTRPELSAGRCRIPFSRFADSKGELIDFDIVKGILRLLRSRAGTDLKVIIWMSDHLNVSKVIAGGLLEMWLLARS